MRRSVAATRDLVVGDLEGWVAISKDDLWLKGWHIRGRGGIQRRRGLVDHISNGGDNLQWRGIEISCLIF